VQPAFQEGCSPLSSTSQSINNPAISIVIPFFNPGPFFISALKSIFAQTFTDWELLLLDDGSTDESLKIASQICDQRVRVYTDGMNRGLSFRLNQGAQLGHAKYIFRMDADDLMHPNRLAEQLEVLQSSQQETVVGTACYSIDESARVIGWHPVEARRHVGFSARHSFIHPTVAASTAWFRKNPYSDEFVYRRSEDAELWCRTASYTEFKWICKPLLFYREIGVFSLTNYLATGKGLLHLIRELEPSRSRRWWLGAKERTKMTIAWGLDALHCSDLMVQHRYSRLTATERAEAELVIDRVLNISIPMR